MHGRRHQATSLPEKLLHFLAFFIAILSLKTKFIFNAPPYASAKAFYLYLLHDTSKKVFLCRRAGRMKNEENFLVKSTKASWKICYAIWRSIL
jgi:hypothetical protein